MRILSFNQGHDVGSTFLDNCKLVFAHEAEKDSEPRHFTSISISLLIHSLQMENPPDVLAYSGWFKRSESYHASTDVGYFGIGPDAKLSFTRKILGQNIRVFSTSHERSHVMCSYGLSGFPQGQPCYALVWEGSLGSFYYIDSHVNMEKIGDVLSEPGNRYAFAYALADPTMPVWSTYIRLSDPGKLMALAAYGNDSKSSKDEIKTIKAIMEMSKISNFPQKSTMQNNKYFNIGLESQEFKNLARRFSDALFDRFYVFAKKTSRKNYLC
jgi:predicted NodU family carbamoyl transferase